MNLHRLKVKKLRINQLSENIPISSISVKTLFEDNKKRLQLELISQKGSFKKQVTEKELHRPGLALAGYVDLFTFHRVQICGNTEITYLNKLTSNQRVKTLEKVFAFDIPCFIVSGDNPVPDEFIKVADQNEISVFRTPFATTKMSNSLVLKLPGGVWTPAFMPPLWSPGELVYCTELSPMYYRTTVVRYSPPIASPQGWTTPE